MREMLQQTHSLSFERGSGKESWTLKDVEHLRNVKKQSHPKLICSTNSRVMISWIARKWRNYQVQA